MTDFYLKFELDWIFTWSSDVIGHFKSSLFITFKGRN